MIKKIFQETRKSSIEDKLKMSEIYTLYQTIKINSGEKNIDVINNYAYHNVMNWYKNNYNLN